MSFIASLKLHNFRCYPETRLDDVQSGLIVLHGPNGAGKTNILEALSLLVPGRGLRGAKNLEVQCQNEGQPWAVAASLQTQYGPVQLGTGLDAKTEKRVVRINGENARGQNALAEHLSAVWLTPQMDRLFLDSSSHRRRFLDRLVFAFDPGHSGRVTRYENAMRQRSKLLQEGAEKGGADPSWIKGLESQMAETGVAIAAARLEFVERLQAASRQSEDEHFPQATMRATGTLEELLGRESALAVEELFAYQLEVSRPRDAITGGAATGPHKSDLDVVYTDKDMPADQCSTGEQKALLIGITLAHARLIVAERGSPPLLLLDEVAAHLDENRRAALYAILQELGGQVWLTGTDQNLFEAVDDQAQFFEIRNAEVVKRLVAA